MGPKVKMAEPELLVDLRHQLVDFRQPRVGDLEIECAGEVQGFEIIAPIERDMIVCPAASDHQRQLVGGRAVSCPIMAGRDPFDQIDGVGAIVGDIGNGHSGPR